MDGFVEKNMETMSNEMRDIGADSTNAVLHDVFSSGIAIQTSNAQRSSIRGVSVSYQFRSSLQTLVLDLEKTQPHYVRCIKPNPTKSAGVFASSDVLQQLRYSGMLEAIRIRREGYAFREEHEKFYDRFSLLLNPEEIQEENNGIAQLVEVLSKRLHVTDADWQIGHSKIFFEENWLTN